MKKLVFMILSGVVALSAFAGRPISVSELPSEANALLKTHFSSVKVVKVEKDIDDGSVEYEVRLADGTELDFNSKGVWQNIDMPRGKTVPAAIVPNGVKEYLKAQEINSGVEELSRKSRGIFEVELSDGTELRLKG